MIHIEGIDKTVDKLWKYSDTFINAVKKITKTSARMVVKSGKSKAPVGKTKNLQASIKAKYFWKDGPAATVMPRAKKAPHRHLVQAGTVPRSHKSGKSVGVMPKDPFMDGAENSAQSYFTGAVKAEVDKHVAI